MTRIEDLGQHLRVVDGSSTELEIAKAGFPSHLASDVVQVLSLIPPPLLPTALGAVVVHVDADNIEIPGRIYRPEVSSGDLQGATQVHLEIGRCLYTRHHDGYVRERALVALLDSPHSEWSIPYVLILVGEYVKEICESVAERAAGENQQAYQEFAVRNPAFMHWIRQSTIAYWNCYWRRQCRLHEYAGYRALDALGLWQGPAGRRVLRRGGR